MSQDRNTLGRHGSRVIQRAKDHMALRHWGYLGCVYLAFNLELRLHFTLEQHEPMGTHSIDLNL